MQHPGKRLRVVGVACRRRCDRIDRAVQTAVVQHPVVDVDQIVEPNPRQPLPSTAQPATQTRREQRAHQPQRPAVGGLHDAGTDRHHPQARFRGHSGGALPVGNHAGQESVTANAVLTQQRVTAVEAVVADGRGADERAGGVPAAGRQLGEPAGGLDAAVPDGRPVFGREPSGDRRARQMDHRVHPVEQVRSGLLRIPLPLIAATRLTAHQSNDPVPAAGQERRQCRAHQTRRAGDRNRHRPDPGIGGLAVGGEVVGELAVAIDERRPQRRTGNHGVHTVAHAGVTAGRLVELVSVPPPPDDPGRPGPRPVRRQGVHEAMRRVESRRIMLGDPPQTARQAQHGATIGE
jgi:hypothetical protein